MSEVEADKLFLLTFKDLRVCFRDIYPPCLISFICVRANHLIFTHFVLLKLETLTCSHGSMGCLVMVS